MIPPSNEKEIKSNTTTGKWEYANIVGNVNTTLTAVDNNINVS